MFLTPQEYFSRFGTRPRKRLGQHFLTQPNTAEKIVREAGLEESDVAVEIGPGLGALTRFIVGKVHRLHLVELDRDLAEHLEAALHSSGVSAEVLRSDALDFDFLELSRSEGIPLVGARKLAVQHQFPPGVSPSRIVTGGETGRLHGSKRGR